MDIGVIILAIIQGIAEFLPISSSAHLIIFRDLFGIGLNSVNGDIGLIFDIALHFGTLLAILVFFFKDFLNMIVDGFTKGCKTSSGKLLWYIVASTIPAAIAGVLFEYDTMGDYRIRNKESLEERIESNMEGYELGTYKRS